MSAQVKKVNGPVVRISVSELRSRLKKNSIQLMSAYNQLSELFFYCSSSIDEYIDLRKEIISYMDKVDKPYLDKLDLPFVDVLKPEICK